MCVHETNKIQFANLFAYCICLRHEILHNALPLALISVQIRDVIFSPRSYQNLSHFLPQVIKPVARELISLRNKFSKEEGHQYFACLQGPWYTRKKRSHHTQLLDIELESAYL